MSRESQLLTEQRLFCGLSIFENMLLKIEDVLKDSIFNLNKPDFCEFYRLWNAVQFTNCLDTNKSIELVFKNIHILLLLFSYIFVIF